MSEQRIRKYLVHLCLCIVACAVTALSFGAEADNALNAALQGRWEGTLVGAFREQEVSWRFETDEDGALRGFMGPSKSGMPSVPMENLSVTGGQVSFTLAGQRGAFEGSVAPDGITGIWQQGGKLPLHMKKKHFVFALSDAIRAALVGGWDMRGEGAEIHVEFFEADNGTLSGTLSIPESGVNATPLVDIFVTDDGFAQFSTDNGRHFTGRLVNGVLVGEYLRDDNRTRYNRPFQRTGQKDREFDVALSDNARQKFAGRWYWERFGDDVVLEVTPVDANVTRAQLLLDKGRETDPLLELKVDGENLRFTTLNGRVFGGSFDGENIAGEYRANNRPQRATWSRTPPD
jgi:hypothetical protein